MSFNSVICQYQWACTAPNENGQRYIPSVRDRPTSVSTQTTTDGSILHIYRVQNLDASCYGPVTAVEYCYRYSSSAGSGQATFSWTVLILEDIGSNFLINNTYLIQSSPSKGSANCTNSGDQTTCCDVTNTERFDLPVNFIFGMTESAQGNTHDATLLGHYEVIYPQRIVGTTLVSKGSLTLSVGSTFAIPSGPGNPRGLRMLLFVVGKHQYCPPQHT